MHNNYFVSIANVFWIVALSIDWLFPSSTISFTLRFTNVTLLTMASIIETFNIDTNYPHQLRSVCFQVIFQMSELINTCMILEKYLSVGNLAPQKAKHKHISHGFVEAGFLRRWLEKCTP